jgi:hypothetical protein
MLTVGVAGLLALGGAGVVLATQGDGEGVVEAPAEPVALTGSTPRSELAPEPEPERAAVPVDLAEVAWEEQAWTAPCAEPGEPSRLTLSPGAAFGELSGSVDDPTSSEPMTYTVELERALFGDVTGDGLDDAVFTTHCTLGEDVGSYVEVWSHDQDGEPTQLPPVVAYSDREASIDDVEIAEGSLLVHTSEPASADDTGDHDRYPVLVVTAWSFDGQVWVAEERSRTDTAPRPEPEPEPAPAPEPAPEATGAPSPDAVPGCEDAAASDEATVRCLIAAVNAEAYDVAAEIAADDVVAALRESRAGGPIDWEFNVCEAASCWFSQPPPDPQWHGVGIEMGMEEAGDGSPFVAWVQFYG